MAGEPPPQRHDDLGAPISAPPPPSSLFGTLTQALNLIGTLMIIAMGVAVNLDVLGRNLFNHPVPGVYEFLGLSIVSVVFLQMANTLREDRHVSNDIIMRWIGETRPGVAHFFYGLFNATGAALMLLIVWFVSPIWLDIYQNGYFKGTSGYIEIPIWPFTGTVIVGGLATAVQYLLFAVRDFNTAFGHWAAR